MRWRVTLQMLLSMHLKVVLVAANHKAPCRGAMIAATLEKNDDDRC
jgi:hypothetical protein